MGDNIATLMNGPASSGIGFSTVFILIMFIILAITAIHMYYKSQESYKLGMQIPGPDPIPILGNALMAIGKTPERKFSCSDDRKKNPFVSCLEFIDETSVHKISRIIRRSSFTKFVENVVNLMIVEIFSRNRTRMFAA